MKTINGRRDTKMIPAFQVRVGMILANGIVMRVKANVTGYVFEVPNAYITARTNERVQVYGMLDEESVEAFVATVDIGN